MPERPEYVPDDWPRDRADRWLAASPRRMLIWWICVALFCAGLAALVLSGGDSRPTGYVALAVAPFAILNAVVQGVRARRAMRHDAGARPDAT